MKNLFEPARAEEIKQRIAQLTPDSPRQWGKMNVAQALAHCTAGLELASGDRLPPRLFLGRIIGAIIKPLALRDDEPMRKNSPTVPGLVMVDLYDFTKERQRLSQSVDRFISSGRQGCTSHPHSFFGKLTPDQWAILMYKHLDHHLRQFAG